MEEISQNKKSSKLKVYIFLFILALGLGIYGYFWIQKNKALRLEAESAIIRAEKYDALKITITEERQRCEGFIAQKEGNFGSFEYCKGFIQWANSVEN